MICFVNAKAIKWLLISGPLFVPPQIVEAHTVEMTRPIPCDTRIIDVGVRVVRPVRSTPASTDKGVQT